MNIEVSHLICFGPLVVFPPLSDLTFDLNEPCLDICGQGDNLSLQAPQLVSDGGHDVVGVTDVVGVFSVVGV